MSFLTGNRNIIGYICALLATALWAGNFVIARGVSDSVPPVTLAFLRWSVAVLVFTPFALRGTIRDFNIVKKNFVYLLIVSLLGVTMFNTIVYYAARTTTALNLSLISITFPVFVLIISRFVLNERITVVKITGLIVVLTGVVGIITKGSVKLLMSFTFQPGDLWMLLAAIIFAVYSTLLRRKPKDINIFLLQYSTFVTGLIALIPLYIYEFFTTPAIEYTTTVVLSVVYVGVFASLIAFILWNSAVQYIGPSKSGMVYYTLPLFSGLLAWAVLNEGVGLTHFVSGVLIITGIIISNLKKQKQ
ncbi:MAG: DMT family transporter [Bacteroidales bacterium]|jgi:drug/metabolite transporter (DMT)-like permease|nr:DMT family transporter [Bacteroidales bacterium]